MCPEMCRKPHGKQGYWTFCGHANSLTRHFTDMPICKLWTICGKTFHGLARLSMDKLSEVTALPIASSRAEIVKS